MKMMYERPVMRVEEFCTNAYCGACNWRPVGSSKTSYWEAVVTQGSKSYTFHFDQTMISAQNDNDNKAQHYFAERVGADSIEGLSNGSIIHGGTESGTSTYFLEWSANNNAFYVYQDMQWSGYDRDQANNREPDENAWAPIDPNTNMSNGVGSLQVNGSNQGWNSNGEWHHYYPNGVRDGWYRADMSVIKGVAANVKDSESTIIQYGYSY